MTRDDQWRAAEIADDLLPLVESHWTAAGAEVVQARRDAGEVGTVLESVLLTADKRGIDLPLDLLQAAGESLAVPGMCPPGTDLEALQRIVARRTASVPA